VDFFGGEEGFKKTEHRDREKNKKAKENGVLLIRVKEGYSEERLVKNIYVREKEVKG